MMLHSEIKTGAASFPENAPAKTQQPKLNKENMILAIMKAGLSLNRFQAEVHGDHCLHSTIATLRGKGYVFHDEWEAVRTRFGRTVRVKRYSYMPLTRE